MLVSSRPQSVAVTTSTRTSPSRAIFSSRLVERCYFSLTHIPSQEHLISPAFKPPRKVKINKVSRERKKKGRALTPRPPIPAHRPPQSRLQKAHEVDCSDSLLDKKRPFNIIKLNLREQLLGDKKQRHLYAGG